MAKKRTDEEIAEEYYKARLNDPNAKPPEDYSTGEFSARLLESIRRSMMSEGFNIGDRISRGKRLAKERRAREGKEAARREALPGKKIDK